MVPRKEKGLNLVINSPIKRFPFRTRLRVRTLLAVFNPYYSLSLVVGFVCMYINFFAVGIRYFCWVFSIFLLNDSKEVSWLPNLFESFVPVLKIKARKHPGYSFLF